MTTDRILPTTVAGSRPQLERRIDRELLRTMARRARVPEIWRGPEPISSRRRTTRP